MKVRGTRITELVAMCAVALTAVACSSSGTSGPAGGSSSSSGSDVVVGTIGAFSGALGSNEAGIPEAADVWASSVNASGRLNGHQVRIVTKDIGNETGADVGCARALISQDHVAAIFDFDTEDSTWLPYAQSNDVPVISFTSAGSQSSSAAFPISIAQSAFAYALPALAKSAGPKLGIVYCAEVPSCGGLASLFKSIAKSSRSPDPGRRQGLILGTGLHGGMPAAQERRREQLRRDRRFRRAGQDRRPVPPGGAHGRSGAERRAVAAGLDDGPGLRRAAGRGQLRTVLRRRHVGAQGVSRRSWRRTRPSMVDSATDNSYSEAAWLDGSSSARPRRPSPATSRRVAQDRAVRAAGRDARRDGPAGQRTSRARPRFSAATSAGRSRTASASRRTATSTAVRPVLDKIRSGG